jgi:hypothetical protein
MKHKKQEKIEEAKIASLFPFLRFLASYGKCHFKKIYTKKSEDNL